MEGRAHLKYLTLLAQEYKFFDNFYHQINCAAEAFDLLRKTKEKVQFLQRGLESYYSDADKKLSKALGSIKFLDHLKAEVKQKNCKNCNSITENMVFMSTKLDF